MQVKTKKKWWWWAEGGGWEMVSIKFIFIGCYILKNYKLVIY